MPFSQPNGVKYFSFGSLRGLGVTQMVFTRAGGVSQGPWESLNVGLTVGDDPENVARNREISFEAAGRPVETLSDSWLVHGSNALIYDEPRPQSQVSPPKADIILTDNPEVTLFMRYADCVPILLVDPVKRAVGLAHAGWKGTVLRTAEKAVQAMTARYGSKPADLLAGIGPSIGPERYEVGPEVAVAVRAVFDEDAERLLPAVNGSTHFDLWEANRLTLAQAGVHEIEVAEICTAENTADWFSHRAEDGVTGRFGALLALED